MHETILQQIDEVVKSGKLVVSGNDETIVAIVKAAIQNDVSASFYLTRQQFVAVRAWYWTPERIKITGLKAISHEEEEKILALGVKNIDNFRYAPFRCECGRTYGALDFFQQGVRQHGLQVVNAVFSLQNSTLFQVNPPFVPICPGCGRSHNQIGGVTPMMQYEGDRYGGCCCCAANVFLKQ